MLNPIKSIKDLRRNLRLNRLTNKVFDSAYESNKMGKQFWKSKTFWVNLLALLNELLKILPMNPSIQSVLIPDEIVAAGLPVVNIALRKMTKVPLVVSKLTPEEVKQ